MDALLRLVAPSTDIKMERGVCVCVLLFLGVCVFIEGGGWTPLEGVVE